MVSGELTAQPGRCRAQSESRCPFGMTLMVDRVFPNFMRSTPGAHSSPILSPEAGLLITAASSFLSLNPESLANSIDMALDRTPRCDKDVRDLLVGHAWLTSVAISRSRLVSGRDVAASFVASVVAPHPFAREAARPLAVKRAPLRLSRLKITAACAAASAAPMLSPMSSSPREIDMSSSASLSLNAFAHWNQTSSRSRRHLG